MVIHRSAVLLAAAALAIRLPLANRPLWHDELFVTAIHLKDLAHLAGTFLVSGVLPFYYLVMFVWIRLFGDSEIAVRVLPLAAGLASIAVVHALASRVADRPTAFLAALWVALSPVHAWYSVEARPYAANMLFVSGILLSFWKLSERPRSPRWEAAFLLLLTAAVWTHYFAAAFIAAVLLLSGARTAGRRRLLGFALWCAVVLVPLGLFYFLKNDAERLVVQLNYARPFYFREAFNLFFKWFLCGNSFPDRTGFAFRACQAIFAAAFLNGVWTLWREKSGRGRDVLVFLFAVPAPLLALSLAGCGKIYIEWSTLFSLPFFAIVTARGFTALPAGPSRKAGIVFLLFFQAATVFWFFWRDRNYTVMSPRPDWRAAAGYFGEAIRTRGPNFLVLHAGGGEAGPLFYYEPRLYDGMGQWQAHERMTAAADLLERRLGKDHPLAKKIRSGVPEWTLPTPPLSTYVGESGKLPSQAHLFPRLYLVKNKHHARHSDKLAAQLSADPSLSPAGHVRLSGVDIYRFDRKKLPSRR